MPDPKPKKQTKPQMKRIDGPPKPPTKVTLDLDELGPLSEGHPQEDLVALPHARSTYFELVMLHGGGRRTKRESLELSLDRNIVLLGKVIPKLEGILLEVVVRLLRDIREYRREFPRTDASNQEQADQAHKILDEIPEVALANASMSEPRLIWNRACGTVGPEARAGDRALSALLRANGLTMNGGLLHAAECLSPSELEAAASGYRFFGLDAAARLLLGARRIFEAGHDLAEHEPLLDRDYHTLIPNDSSLYARFEQHRSSHPQDFAPPS